MFSFILKSLSLKDRYKKYHLMRLKQNEIEVCTTELPLAHPAKRSKTYIHPKNDLSNSINMCFQRT